MFSAEFGGIDDSGDEFDGGRGGGSREGRAEDEVFGGSLRGFGDNGDGCGRWWWERGEWNSAVKNETNSSVRLGPSPGYSHPSECFKAIFDSHPNRLDTPFPLLWNLLQRHRQPNMLILHNQLSTFLFLSVFPMVRCECLDRFESLILGERVRIEREGFLGVTSL